MMDYLDNESAMEQREESPGVQDGGQEGQGPEDAAAVDDPGAEKPQPEENGHLDLEDDREDGQDEPPAESTPEQEKPKRRTRKKKEDLPDVSEELPSSGLPDAGPLFPDDVPDGLEDEGGESDQAEEGPMPADTEPGNVEEAAPRRRRAASRRSAVLDSSGNVIYERADSGQHDLSVLTAAHNARRILTATVDALETDGDILPRVVFYSGTVKVMIPFSQMGFDLDPEAVTPREARLLIDSMLGARIDYMVRGVDTESRIAAGSRRDAMLMRQRTILNARSASDPNEYRINEGMRVTARIVHVSRNAVRVEVYGFESYVRIDSISNLWVNDIREVVQVGEERPVEIVSLQRDEFGRAVSMRVSLRAAENAPQMALRNGNTYTGHISSFSETAYYVRVAGIPVEVRCPIRSNHSMELMNVGDYVKFYVRGIHDGVPTGAILKIIKKKVIPRL